MTILITDIIRTAFEFADYNYLYVEDIIEIVRIANKRHNLGYTDEEVKAFIIAINEDSDISFYDYYEVLKVVDSVVEKGYYVGRGKSGFEDI